MGGFRSLPTVKNDSTGLSEKSWQCRSLTTAIRIPALGGSPAMMFGTAQGILPEFSVLDHERSNVQYRPLRRRCERLSRAAAHAARELTDAEFISAAQHANEDPHVSGCAVCRGQRHRPPEARKEFVLDELNARRVQALPVRGQEVLGQRKGHPRGSREGRRGTTSRSCMRWCRGAVIEPQDSTSRPSDRSPSAE